MRLQQEVKEMLRVGAELWVPEGMVEGLGAGQVREWVGAGDVFPVGMALRWMTHGWDPVPNIEGREGR